MSPPPQTTLLTMPFLSGWLTVVGPTTYMKGTYISLLSWAIALTVCSSVPTPTNNTTLPLSPNRCQAILSLKTFPSPTSSPSSKGSISPHIPAPSCSVLVDDFPNPRSLLNTHSDAGPVDPNHASLWLPASFISVPICAKDGEFERFILDEQGCLRNHDLMSHPALFLWLRHYTNCLKSCYAAWERAEAIDIHTHFSPHPLGELIHFWNNVALLCVMNRGK